MQTPSEQVLTLPKCNIHLFKLKQKALILSGECQVFQTPERLQIKGEGAGVDLPKHIEIVRVSEVTYVSYLYLCATGGTYAISIPKSDQIVQSLEAILERIYDLKDLYLLGAETELRKKITADCPVGSSDQGQLGETNGDKLEEVTSGIGNIFGGISSVFDVDKYNKSSSEAIHNISRDTFSEKTISKWEKFKQGCSQINEALTDLVKPVNQKCREIVSDIGNNFDNSQNSFIKGVRQFSRKTERGFNEGYTKADPSKARNSQQN